MTFRSLLAFLPLAGTAAAAATLYDNGPIVTGTGNGFGGANTSATQTIGTQGPGGLQANPGFYRLIEEFVVPEGESWTLQELSAFAFHFVSSSSQQNPPVSTFTRIWAGLHFADPERTGAEPARGGFALQQNRFLSTRWTGAYRVIPTSLLTRNNAIMEIVGDVADLSPEPLGPGVYWIEWGVRTADDARFTYSPLVTPYRPDGNALQREVSTNRFVRCNPLEFPFQLRGQSQGLGGFAEVRGQVEFDGIADPSVERLRIDLVRDGAVVETRTVRPAADGTFVLRTLRSGTFDVVVSGTTLLSRRKNGAIIAADYAAEIPLMRLPNGDIDGDGTVTVFDYDRLSRAFDAVGPDWSYGVVRKETANWDPFADLDRDNSVTVFDYDILSRNFDASGE